MDKFTSVESCLASLPPERREIVERVRQEIIQAEPKLVEHIKWNAPSYVFDGEDRITFNLHYPDKILVLIHMGATRKENKAGEPVMADASGLISWNSDIRGTITFTSLKDVEAKAGAFRTIVTQWLALS